jgi:class 3 adenylate cyclase
MSRSLRTFGKALGVLIMLVGLSGIPGDLANWASWVGETSGEQWRWALLLLGLAAAVGSSVPDLWERFGRQQPSSDGTTGPPPARAGRGELPTGTVTFLFTDIEGSTRLLQELGEGYAALRDDQAAIVRHAVREAAGVEVSTEGDSFFVAFGSPVAAVRAAVAAQQGLAGHHWPAGAPPRVRMGLHTGDGVLGGDNYVGIDVNR